MNSPKIINQENPNNFSINSNISTISNNKNYFQIAENKKNRETCLNKYNNFSPKDNKPKREVILKKNAGGEIKLFNKKIKQEDEQIIRTSVSFDNIRQVIKKFVGNNVVENNDERNFKFICKTNIGKDELIFYLELISINFEMRIFKGTLIQGETKLYKDLLLKIKEKLS